MSQNESEFSKLIDFMSDRLTINYTINKFSLNNMNLFYCNGCWNCWWKTPGRCVIEDEAQEILASVINSDFVIFASPLKAGFTSSALKKITDRLVALVHPYVIIKNGETHHKKRHEKYPSFGLILQKEFDTDAEDISIVNDIYERLALNFHSQKKYTKFISNTNIEEIIDETCNN